MSLPDEVRGLTCRDAVRCHHGNCILATVTVIFRDNPGERLTAVACHKSGCRRKQGPAGKDRDAAVREWNAAMLAAAPKVGE